MLYVTGTGIRHASYQISVSCEGVALTFTDIARPGWTMSVAIPPNFLERLARLVRECDDKYQLLVTPWSPAWERPDAPDAPGADQEGIPPSPFE